jgi:TetR/AcrR family transcriptional regulator, regulator of cefoperazone and chloramphenicol sensitivity
MIQTRQKIIRAATKLFANKGLNGTSIREISRKANVNLAAINYHFQSKEQLYMEIITQHFQRLCDNIAQLEQQEIDGEESYIQYFVEYNLDMLFHRDKEMELIVARELSVPSARRDQLARDFFAPALNSLIRRIKKGIAGKRFRRVDATLSAISLVGMCVFYANKRAMLGHMLGIDTVSDQFRQRVAAHITDSFLRGIRR